MNAHKKRVVISAIFLVALLAAGIGLMLFRGEQEDPEPKPGPKPGKGTSVAGDTSPDAEPKRPPEETTPLRQQVTIAPETMYMVGNTLYQLGSTEPVASDWLEKFRADAVAQIFYYEPAEVIVVGFSGQRYSAYKTDGTQIGLLTLSNGEVFNGFVKSSLEEALYLKEGDIWKARIDWSRAKLKDEQQLTKVGFFAGRPFADKLFLVSESAVIYNDMRSGMIRVELATGTTEPVRLMTPTSQRSSDRRLLMSRPPGRGPMVCYDVESNKAHEVALPEPIPSGGMFWIDEKRCALQSGKRSLLLYDFEERKLLTLYQTTGQLKPLPNISPSGAYMILVDGSQPTGLIRVSTRQGEGSEKLFNAGTNMEWLSDDAVLVTRDVPASEYRGTWVHSFTTGKEKRVFEQPIVASRSRAVIRGVLFAEQNRTLIAAFGKMYEFSADGEGDPQELQGIEVGIRDQIRGIAQKPESPAQPK